MVGWIQCRVGYYSLKSGREMRHGFHLKNCFPPEASSELKGKGIVDRLLQNTGWGNWTVHFSTKLMLLVLTFYQNLIAVKVHLENDPSPFSDVPRKL